TLLSDTKAPQDIGDLEAKPSGGASRHRFDASNPGATSISTPLDGRRMADGSRHQRNCHRSWRVFRGYSHRTRPARSYPIHILVERHRPMGGARLLRGSLTGGGRNT